MVSHFDIGNKNQITLCLAFLFNHFVFGNQKNFLMPSYAYIFDLHLEAVFNL